MHACVHPTNIGWRHPAWHRHDDKIKAIDDGCHRCRPLCALLWWMHEHQALEGYTAFDCGKDCNVLNTHHGKPRAFLRGLGNQQQRNRQRRITTTGNNSTANKLTLWHERSNRIRHGKVARLRVIG